MDALTERRVNDALQVEAEQKARAARLDAAAAEARLRPHVVYKARVWRTSLNEEGKQWACGLVYDGGFVSHVGTVYMGTPMDVVTGWSTPYPVAFGETPDQACEAFDELWKNGLNDV